MSKGVGQSRVSVRVSRCRDPVQRFVNRAVANCMYVNNQPLFIGGYTQRAKLLRIKQ
jgi:hypothetical protein